jgi:hypothetical protein
MSNENAKRVEEEQMQQRLLSLVCTFIKLTHHHVLMIVPPLATRTTTSAYHRLQSHCTWRAKYKTVISRPDITTCRGQLRYLLDIG